MDIPRVTSPPSIHVYDFNASHGPGRSFSRSFTNSYSKSQRPMAIPHAKAASPPPPLPPPRYICEDTASDTPAIEWRDTFNSGSAKSDGSSFSPRSSLRGSWDQNMTHSGMAHRGSASRPDRRRGSPTSKVKPQPELEMKCDFSRFVDEGYHSLSGSSLANQHLLHGERPLERHNVANSSQAYDNKIVSKLGKPRTPPRSTASSFDAASPTSSFSFYQSGKHPLPLKSLSISEGSRGQMPESPLTKGSPFSAYGGSPRSRAISPSLISPAASAKSHMDIRSPLSTSDSSVPPSAMDPYPPQHRHYSAGSIPSVSRHQHRNRRSGSGSVFSAWDESAGSSVQSDQASGARGAKRANDEQSVFAEPDMDEPGTTSTTATATNISNNSNTTALRQLHLDDRDTHDPAPYQQNSQFAIFESRVSGMKRGASSPPPEASRGDKVPLHSVGGSSSHHAANNRQSPINPYAQPHGSVSSASSIGLRNGSYASSGPLSLPASSLTSISSHERLSPRGLSPSLEYQQTPPNPQYPAQISMNPSPRESNPRPTHQRTSPDSRSAAAIARKMSSDSPTTQRKGSAPSLQAHVQMCTCCPKKPKKFDTLEELRAHESEKQYHCQYCHNKFKNKNEAERHQNSLHIRRHSWSCATLANTYERAFHPPAAAPHNPNNPNSQLAASADNISAVDICGYCGKEFSNIPTPNWEERIVHLTNVHKFGECNQSKKFFRADHFRQHLKHSHAGTSGKWTNQLEAACMKPEPPPMADVLSQQQQQQQQQLQGGGQGVPVANMLPMQAASRGMSMGLMGQSGGLRDDRIEEMHEGL